MDLADDIAYGVHDLEDVIGLRLLTAEQFREAVPATVCQHFVETLRQRYSDEFAIDAYENFLDQLFGRDPGMQKRQISRLVHYFLVSAYIAEQREFEEPLLRFKVLLRSHEDPLLKALKSFIFKSVTKGPAVQLLEFKGQQMWWPYSTRWQAIRSRFSHQRRTDAILDQGRICG